MYTQTCFRKKIRSLATCAHMADLNYKPTKRNFSFDKQISGGMKWLVKENLEEILIV